MKRTYSTIILLLFLGIVNAQNITNGLIGYYPFTGNANDASGNGFNGSVNGPVLDSDRDGNVQSSYKFNGGTDAITVPDNAVLENTGKSITISGWVKPTANWASDYRASVAAKGGYDVNYGYELLIRGDMAIEWDIATEGCGTSVNAIPLNTYSHVVAVFDDANNLASIYINGKLIASNTVNGSITAGNAAFSIGRRCDGNYFAASFQGNLDEIRVYNRALSQTEINLLYNGISIQSPQSGFLLSGSTNKIIWQKVADISSVDLSYSSNNGSTWISIATNISDTSYNWTVPASLTDSLKIRIANHAILSHYSETSLISIVDKELNYGLYGYYKLNGNTNDASSKGNNAQAYNITDTTDNNGFSKRAFYFDSDADSLRPISSGNPFRTGTEGTISLWVREANFATSTTENLVLNRYDAGNAEFQLNFHANASVGLHFRYGTWGSGSDVILTYPQSRNWLANSWHNVAIRWKRTGSYTYLSLFADGLLVSQTSTSLLIDNEANWLFGAPNDGVSRLNGSLDEIRLYNKALSDELVYKIYQDGLPMMITNPEEGTDVVKSTQQTIKWHVPQDISAINIDFSSNNGTSWTNLATNVSTSTAFITWNVPAQTSDSCKFRISTPGYPSIYHIQNKKFRIVADSSLLNLVYYYKLNENAADSSGNHNDGSLNGGTLTKGIDNASSGAYLFNGSSDYIDVPSSATANLDQFTFSCWIKTTDLGYDDAYYNRPCIFGNDIDGSSNSDLGIITNFGYLGLWSGLSSLGDNQSVSGYFLSDNNWHNVTCTYNGHKIELYVDGKDVHCSLSGDKALNSDGYFIMAKKHSYYSQAYHQGTLDEVRFYNKALDSASIVNLYNKLKPVYIVSPKYKQDLAKGSQTDITWHNTK